MKSETNEGEMELESGKSAERLTNRGETNRDEYIPREMKRIDCWAGAYFHIDECRSHWAFKTVALPNVLSHAENSCK